MNLVRKLFPKSATVEHQNGRIDIQAQRWAVSYVPFPVVDCGVIGIGQLISTMPSFSVGYRLVSPAALRFNESSMRGAWVATNPFRHATLFSVVARNAGKWEEITQLRYLAAALQNHSGKSRFGWVSRILTRFEDRPAADALCRYIAEHAVYDEDMRKRPMLSPHQKFLAARKAREEAFKEAE